MASPIPKPKPPPRDGASSFEHADGSGLSATALPTLQTPDVQSSCATSAKAPTLPASRRPAPMPSHARSIPGTQTSYPFIPPTDWSATRGRRVLRLRDMQRDRAVICLPLQHHFQMHYCQSCNRPVVMESHDRSPCSLSADTATWPWSSRCSSSRVPPVRERLACPPRSAGRGCYRALRRGTLTVAQ